VFDINLAIAIEHVDWYAQEFLFMESGILFIRLKIIIQMKYPHNMTRFLDQLLFGFCGCQHKTLSLIKKKLTKHESKYVPKRDNQSPTLKSNRTKLSSPTHNYRVCITFSESRSHEAPKSMISLINNLFVSHLDSALYG
jgi:hypothetical protein